MLQQNDKASAPSTIHLKGQWIKALHSPSKLWMAVCADPRQDQLTEVKLRIRELIGGYHKKPEDHEDLPGYSYLTQ
ncbi:hypothetical protein [Xenorhabdus bovienii]|uniref:hypothetical protein n=1 Tax=Xenorhabdus bovienii TaxID=40576 RepID=UPI003DA23D42